MQEKETTTKIQLEIHWQKYHADSHVNKRARERESAEKGSSLKHTHTHVAGLPLTHMLIMCTQREQQQQEEPQQTYKYKYKCRTTTKLTTRLATGTGRWEQGGRARVENWSGVGGAVAVAALAAVVVHLLPFARRLFK